MKYLSQIVLVLLVFTFGCSPKTTEKLEENEPIVATVEIEERTLDELVITATKDYVLPRYNPAATRKNDLLHTKLEVSFDFEKQHVLGKASLDFTPYFYPTKTLVLDAKGFDLHKITLANGKELKYTYDGELITIQLDKEYKKGEKYRVNIDYTAKPNERTVGGSAAITQDKGLYFINPKGETPNKPTQIWTQGETESNSCWFPTIDKPNERCTQEISITIREDFETLSNGLLKSSTDNGDGTRTDYWVMDLPHAPYLFMMAIGDFAVVKESWRGKEVAYYVEKEYEQYAKRIYPYTLEMLDFYSELYGYDYVWQKYSQVTVRDFVSGAMENTTGVIFGEFMQGTERDLIDEKNNERIVAHELVHHWFGNLVTCESWANLPLNEAFANYGEYLWMEKKHGKEEGDYHLRNEMNGYLGQARSNRHDLIYFDYKDKEQTFDGHSYNKGGAILHALRNYLGDEAFFASLKHYLKTNEYTAVEAHDLRLAFEEITGEDLNWFFNQWFFAAGHPELEVEEKYNDSTKQVEITILQTQDVENNLPIYQLPMAIDVYTNGKMTRHDIKINKRKQQFTFDAEVAPEFVNVDADKVLVGTIQHKKSEAAYISQYKNATNFKSRYEALAALEGEESAAVKAVFQTALNDTHWYIRAIAVKNAVVNDKVSAMAVNDVHSAVRGEALEALGNSENKIYLTALTTAIGKEQAYPVIASALKALTKLDAEVATEYAEKLEKEDKAAIKAAVGNVYAETKNLSKIAYFENNWASMRDFSVSSFMKDYDKLLYASNSTTQVAALNKLKVVAMDNSASLWQRFTATRSIKNLKDYFKSGAAAETNPEKEAFATYATQAETLLIEVIEAETDRQLSGIYKNWLPK